MAATKKETKEPDELEIDEPETPPAKKAATTKKEDAPEWFQTLNNSIKELTNHLQPVKANQAGAVEIPIPQKPTEKKPEGDPENPQQQQQQQQKKQSFLEWLM